MVSNPVMFVTEVGALITTLEIFRAAAHGESLGFVIQIALWLWFTVLFANFAEALAEGRGKAQAEALRKIAHEDVRGPRDRPDGTTNRSPSETLRKGDVVVVQAGQIIPADGEMIEGVATVDEAVITGESAPVIRESGGDRSRGHGRHHGALRPNQSAGER